MLDSRSPIAPLPVRIFDVSDRPNTLPPDPSSRALGVAVLAVAGWSCIAGSVWAAIALL